MSISGESWPALAWEDGLWRGEPYAAAIPPHVEHLQPAVDQEVALLAREAELELARLDGELVDRARAFRDAFLTCDAVASSAIEGVPATAFDAAVARLHGTDQSDESAVAANMDAIDVAAQHSGWMLPDTFAAVHAALMAGRPQHRPGMWREEPVWIRPSVDSPIQAQFHAPHHARLPGLMDDLAGYCRRYDLPPLIHIATAHAQLETVHPFTYGNGRTGRAIALTMLRQRGVTKNITPPLSIGFRADMENYYRALAAYRAGEISPIVAQFAIALLRTVANLRRFGAEAADLQRSTLELARPRAGSIKAALLDWSLDRTAFTAERAAAALSIERTNIYRYLDQLRSAGVLDTFRNPHGPELWYSPGTLRIMHRLLTRFGRR